jgi:tight adherence protein B
MEIVDINGSRYAEGGQTQMVVEFRNLPEAPNPAQLAITVDGQPVSNLEVAPLGESSVPVGVVLVIDTSGSMQGTPMDSAKTAANSFIDQKRPEDAIAIVSFADTAVVQTGFTTNANVLHERVNALTADGETALNDGVILGMSLFENVPANQLNNMIVLSDGEDTASTATAEEAIAAIESGEARVFGVALESPDFNPEAVAAFATAGGGLFLSTPDPAQLEGLYSQISREISNTLVARFVSPVAAPGEAEFAVSYPGGLTSTVSFPVSGYATTTTIAPTTTTVPVPVSGSVVESTSPLDITTLALIAAAGIGLTAFLFIIILFGREEDQGGGRFAKRLQAYGRRSKTGEDEKKPLLQRIPLINRFSQAAEEEVRKRGMLSGVNAALEQANIPMSPGEAILAMIGLAAVGGVFVAIFNSALWGLITFGLLLFGFVVLVRWAGGRERKRFEKQLPDTLTLLSTSLRAGYSLLQAIGPWRPRPRTPPLESSAGPSWNRDWADRYRRLSRALWIAPTRKTSSGQPWPSRSSVRSVGTWPRCCRRWPTPCLPATGSKERSRPSPPKVVSPRSCLARCLLPSVRSSISTTVTICSRCSTRRWAGLPSLPD